MATKLKAATPIEYDQGELEAAVELENRILAASSSILAARSALVGRSDLAARAGKSFGGKRDVNEALGYADDTALTYQVYRGRYDRGGVAESVIEAFPKATWSSKTQILENRKIEDVTAFEKQTEALFRRFKLWDIFEDADILAGIGHYSVIMIGAPGSPETPLRKNLKLSDIKYLKPMSEGRATVDESDLVIDMASERFGLPNFYTVNMSRNSQSVKVHHTRVIHIADGRLDSDLYGKPVLYSIWNYLDDLTKIVGGGSEAFWMRANPGMQIDVDPTLPVGAAEIAALKDQVDEYEHKLRKVFRTRGTKIHMLDGTPTGIGPNVDSILKLISATKRYPMRILTGSERGELASTQDTSAWNGRVDERRNGFANGVVIDFLDRMVNHGVLPAYSDTMEIVWPEVDELGEAEKAVVMEMITKANKQNLEAGNGVIMTGSEIREKFLKLPPAIEPEPIQPEVVEAPVDEEPEPFSVSQKRRNFLKTPLGQIWKSLNS